MRGSITPYIPTIGEVEEAHRQLALINKEIKQIVGHWFGGNAMLWESSTGPLANYLRGKRSNLQWIVERRGLEEKYLEGLGCKLEGCDGQCMNLECHTDG